MFHEAINIFMNNNVKNIFAIIALSYLVKVYRYRLLEVK